MKYIVDKEKQSMVDYAKHLLDGKYESNGVPSMLLYGEPGSGKTSFGKYLAEELKAQFIFAPCFDGIGADQMIYNWHLGKLVDAMTNHVDEEGKKSNGREALMDGFLLQALKSSQQHRTVLLIDEIDKAKPSVDTFLLSYMQECLINDPVSGVIKGNKKNLLIIFTSNKHRELNDALDRRMAIIREFHFPSKPELIKQIDVMLKTPYNRTKFHFLIELAMQYRGLQVEKKPAQNQIADLINEVTSITNQNVGRFTSYELKFTSMLWKFSQNTEDHAVFVQALKGKYKIQDEKKLKRYIGSMI